MVLINLVMQVFDIMWLCDCCDTHHYSVNAWDEDAHLLLIQWNSMIYMHTWKYDACNLKSYFHRLISCFWQPALRFGCQSCPCDCYNDVICFSYDTAWFCFRTRGFENRQVIIYYFSMLVDGIVQKSSVL